MCPKENPEHAGDWEVLLYQALETEIGGVPVYEHAIRCAQNQDLKEEWEKYLEQTRNHERSSRGLQARWSLDAEKETPGRRVVRHHGKSLVQAMVMALKDGTPEAAQLVAAECVVLAETKDHQNWELIGEMAKELKGEEGKVLEEAYEEVEDEEDEHLYHTAGLGTGALAGVSRPARRAAASRGGKGRQDRDADAARAKQERKELLVKGR